MKDSPPLLVSHRLGGLYAANPDAEKAIAAIKGVARIEIKQTKGNNPRLALYWIVLGKVCGPLSQMCEGDPLTSKMLHRVLKRRKGLCSKTTLPSGEVEYNDDSISFSDMTEPERAEYIDWAFETLAKWMRVPVEAITERQAA